MSYRFTSYSRQVLDDVAQRKARALEIVGGKAESYAKQLCPTKTSRLKNSITHQRMDENTEAVGTNVEYAAAVELGHHQEPGRYVPAIKKRLKREFIPGKPFLKPAAEDHGAEYAQIIKSIMNV